MLGAIAMASLSAARQAETSRAGGAAAGGFAPEDVSRPSAGPSGLAGGASAGRGLGSGTAAGLPRDTAAPAPACQKDASITAAAVTMAHWRR